MLSKKILATTAAIALMSGAAFAEDTMSSDPMKSQDNSMKVEDQMSTGDSAEATNEMDATTETAETNTDSMSQDGDFITAQAEGEWLANDLIGSDVKSADGESIGSIDNLVIGDAGEIKAVTVSVGGFLGIGDRVVAVPFDSLQETTDEDGNEVLKLQIDAKALENAPEYKTLEAAKIEQEQMKATQDNGEMGTTAPAAPAAPADQ